MVNLCGHRLKSKQGPSTFKIPHTIKYRLKCFQMINLYYNYIETNKTINDSQLRLDEGVKEVFKAFGGFYIKLIN